MWKPAFALILALGLLAGPAHATSGPENLTLRLDDLPPGYLVGDDSGCGLALIGEGAPRELADMRRHPHRGCVSQFEQLWTPPGAAAGPPLVESASLRFTAAAGPLAGLAEAPAVAARAFGLERDSLTPLSAVPAVSEEALAFETDDALVRGRAGRPGVVVLWRTGRVLSGLLAGGLSGPEAEAAAFALAAAQERRVREPTPLRARDNDDRQVALDNPRLGIGVRWLGERFRPGNGLPPLALADSHGPVSRGGGPGWRVDIDYRGRGAGVKLGLWKPRAFARFRSSRLGRLVWTQRCAASRRIAVQGGRAVIQSGYSSPPRRCGERPPDLHLAHVFLRGLVVTVNVPFCFLCIEPGRADPYAGVAGLRAVVRGLRKREPA